MRTGIDYRPALVNREGIGRYTRELVRGLIDARFGKNLGLFGYTLAPARFGAEELGLAESGAELLRMRFPARWTPTLLRLLNKGVDDLVGGCEVFHHTSTNVLPVRQAVEVVTVHDCHCLMDAGYLDPGVASKMAEGLRAAVKRAKRILVPTEYVGAEVVMHMGVFPGSISVVGLGCDHIARHLPPSVPPASAPYVLTVSRVDARKNHLRMLGAFERLVADGLPHRWVIAGPRGFGCKDFLQRVEASPARARIEWRQDVGERELPLLYAQADLFLFASLNEGFGLPPLEAMACGTPVVASCVTSMPEVLGDAAWLVEPTDEEQIYTAAHQVLTEKEIARDLVAKGEARSREFTWRQSARDTLAAYRLATEPEGQEPAPLHRSL